MSCISCQTWKFCSQGIHSKRIANVTTYVSLTCTAIIATLVLFADKSVLLARDDVTKSYTEQTPLLLRDSVTEQYELNTKNIKKNKVSTCTRRMVFVDQWDHLNRERKQAAENILQSTVKYHFETTMNVNARYFFSVWSKDIKPQQTIFMGYWRGVVRLLYT